MLVVPSLIHGSQPNARDDVDGSVALEKLLVLRFGQDNEAAAFGPRPAVELGAGVPRRRHARRWPWNDGGAKCCFNRRDAALTAGASCWKLTFYSFVEVTSKHDRAELRAEGALHSEMSPHTQRERGNISALIASITRLAKHVMERHVKKVFQAQQEFMAFAA